MSLKKRKEREHYPFPHQKKMGREMYKSPKCFQGFYPITNRSSYKKQQDFKVQWLQTGFGKFFQALSISPVPLEPLLFICLKKMKK